MSTERNKQVVLYILFVFLLTGSLFECAIEENMPFLQYTRAIIKVVSWYYNNILESENVMLFYFTSWFSISPRNLKIDF